METMLSRLSLRTVLPRLRAPATTTTITTQRNYYREGNKVVQKEYYVYRRKDKSKYKANPNPTITLILNENHPIYGDKGTVQNVPRAPARQLITRRLAEYATTENLARQGLTLEKDEEDISRRHGVKLGCSHVITFLTEEGLELRMKPRAFDGPRDRPWMLTRHDVLDKMRAWWHLWVPLHRLTLKTMEGEKIDIITQHGQYTADIWVSPEDVDPPLVVSVPVHIEPRSKHWNSSAVEEGLGEEDNIEEEDNIKEEEDLVKEEEEAEEEAKAEAEVDAEDIKDGLVAKEVEGVTGEEGSKNPQP